MARTGCRFTNAFAHGGGTPESFPSILAAANPPTDYNQYVEVMKRSQPLAETMKILGFATGAIHSNPYLSKYYSYDSGFEMFDEGLDHPWSSIRRILHRIPIPASPSNIDLYGSLFLTRKPPISVAPKVSEKALSWISKQRTQYFLWLHYMDVHQPTLPPARILDLMSSKRRSFYSSLRTLYRLKTSKGRYSKDDLEKLIELYDASIKYVDESVGMLERGLEKMNRRDRTLIILTSDHGECLGEHHMIGHGAVYDPVIHVPLILSGPAISPQVVSEQVTHMGLPQFLLRVIMNETQDLFFPLKHLYKRLGNGVVSVANNYPIGQRICSFRTEEWKLIWIEDVQTETVKHLLFNIRDDPNETCNLAERHSEIVERYNAVLRYFLSQSKEAFAEQNPHHRRPYNREEEENLKSRLRELGYE